MIKRMDSVGNSVIIEERSVGEIINELTQSSDSLDYKIAELFGMISDLETKVDDSDQSDKIESLENRLDDIDYKLDETAEQIKEMARNAETLVNIIKQIATS